MKQLYQTYRPALWGGLSFAVVLYGLMMAQQLTNTFDGLWNQTYYHAGLPELTSGRWLLHYIDKLTLASLIRYAVRNLASFSTAPLQLVTILGALMLLASLVLGGIALVQKLLGQALGGFTTVILIQLFSSSLVMISLGIIGYYLAKLYEEIKDRPRYLIAETCGEDRHASSHEKTP